MRRRKQSGLTCGADRGVHHHADPHQHGGALARAKVRAQRERALRYALDDMRLAIDKYKDYWDMGGMCGPVKQGSDCWPETLESLVEGVKIGSSADDKKIKLLRRIPRDPFNSTEWGLRSDQDDPTANSWGGQNVFDVYTKTDQKAPDGTAYSEW